MVSTGIVGKGEKVLVVDDSRETVNHLVNGLLPSHGFSPAYALDGQTALEKIRAERPDLIMLDLNLPKMTGLDVLEALALEPKQPPVVMMTGGGSEQIAVEAFRLGISDYLVKPFTVEELLETIRRVLDSRGLDGTGAKMENPEQLTIAHNEIRRQKANLMRLLHISKSITALTDFSAITQKVLGIAVDEFRSEHALIWLPEGGRLQTIQLNIGDEDAFVPEEAVYSRYVEHVINTGAAVRHSDFSDGLDVGMPIKARALLYVPLTVGDDLRGVLGICNTRQALAFSELDELFLNAIGSYTSIALSNSNFIQDTRSKESEHLQDMYALADITQSLVTNSAETVIRETLEYVIDRWEVGGASIWICDKANGNVKSYMNLGDGEGKLDGVTVPIGTGFVGYTTQTGRWMFSNSVQGHVRHYDGVDKVTGLNTQSLMSVPLIYQDQILGSLQLVNRYSGSFSAKDVDAIFSVTTILALAVHQLQLENKL